MQYIRCKFFLYIIHHQIIHEEIINLSFGFLLVEIFDCFFIV
jgi:hypothetical protein